MNSNLNFDIDTESLLLQPDDNFPCFSTAKKSGRLLLDHCESLISDNTSTSSTDPLEFDICTPLKPNEKYKEKARHKIDKFKSSVDRLIAKRKALNETTELLKLKVKEFLDVPLLSKRNLMNLNY